MHLSLNRRRSVNNVQVLQKIQNNSLMYFSKYEKQAIQRSQVFGQKQALFHKNNDSKSQVSYVSINDSLSQIRKLKQSEVKLSLKRNSSQNKIYSILMKQSSDITFSNQNFNKQNDINSCNSSQLSFSSESKNQKKDNVEHMQNVVNEKLLKCYGRVQNTKKKLDDLENYTNTNQNTSGIKKIQLIERLINVLQTNKEVRIRQMFEQRQKISEMRQERKKSCNRKLDHIKQVESQFKDRKIDEYRAILQLKNIRG